MFSVFISMSYWMSNSKGIKCMQVSAGIDCVFAQDAVAVNTAEKHCCVIGELNKRAIVTPDVGSIINSMADL